MIQSGSPPNMARSSFDAVVVKIPKGPEAISPSSRCFHETASSLRFSQRQRFSAPHLRKSLQSLLSAGLLLAILFFPSPGAAYRCPRGVVAKLATTPIFVNLNTEQVAGLRLRRDASDRKARVALQKALKEGKIIPAGEALTFGDAYARAAVKEFEDGHITQEQLGSILMRWQLLSATLPLEPIRREDFSCLNGRGTMTSEGVRWFAKGLTPTERARFATALKALPQSEQQFTVVWLSEKPAEDSEWKIHNLVSGVLEPTFPGLGGKFEEENGHSIYPIVCPSVGIVQAYLVAKFGENAVTLQPEIGATDRKAYEEAFGRDVHPIGMSAPGAAVPNFIDGIKGNGPGFSAHDIYHAIRLSQIPKSYRKLLFHLLQTVENDLETARYRSGRLEITNKLRFDLYAHDADERPISDIRQFILDGTLNSYPEDPVGRRLRYDFGPRIGAPGVGLYLSLVVRDLATNPAWYEEQKYSVSGLISEMGPDAQRLYDQIRQSLPRGPSGTPR